MPFRPKPKTLRGELWGRRKYLPDLRTNQNLRKPSWAHVGCSMETGDDAAAIEWLLENYPMTMQSATRAVNDETFQYPALLACSSVRRDIAGPSGHKPPPAA